MAYQRHARPRLPAGPDQKTWDSVAGKAANFLKGTQEANGGWSTAKSPGVTGVVLTGLLKSGEVTVEGSRRGEGAQLYRKPRQSRA